CSRGIRNAWHFYYALFLVIKVVCGGFGIALLTPLTGRYTLKIKRSSNSLKSIGYTYRQFQGFIIKGVNMYLQK
uniref:hypothetical protein n=1 Tax=Vibrio parahaemolyticus TaxID=670 RepID=UPI002D1E3693